MGIRFKATHVVLAMLCAMYFITYVDRVNIGTAASAIQKELGLSNTQLGPRLLRLRLSLSVVPDHRRLGRRSFRAAQDPVLVRHDLGGRHHLDGLRRGLSTLFVARCRARLRRGRDLPDRDARDAVLDAGGQARVRAGPHPRLRAARQRRDAAAGRAADAWLTWRGSFVVLGWSAWSGS